MMARISLAALVCLAGIAHPAMAQDRRVEIINQTGYTITHFYGSNSGTDSWEEDILGEDVLPNNNSLMINFDDGTGYCLFDFRAVFEDGEELVKEGVNVCEITQFTYN